jgi:hypothetical protein
MRTVLAAILDTPVARRELAAVFLAASSAWEIAVRENGWRPAYTPQPLTPQPPAQSSPVTPTVPASQPAQSIPVPTTSYLPTSTYTPTSAFTPRRDSTPPRRARSASPPARAAVPVRDVLGRAHGAGCAAEQEQRALATFCTHTRVPCASCAAPCVEGPAYVCGRCGRGLCEPCRRAAAGDYVRCAFTVYDHPWEALPEYHRGDLLRVPRAPLRAGEAGLRVLHLHYVLYKMGYLRLGSCALRVGVFCDDTRRTVARFQRDHLLVSDEAYSAAMTAPGSVCVPPVAHRAGPSATQWVGSDSSATRAPRAQNPRYACDESRACVNSPAPGACVYPVTDVPADIDADHDLDLGHDSGSDSDSEPDAVVGVFTVATRAAIVALVEAVELSYRRARCSGGGRTNTRHMPAATVTAA